MASKSSKPAGDFCGRGSRGVMRTCVGSHNELEKLDWIWREAPITPAGDCGATVWQLKCCIRLWEIVNLLADIPPQVLEDFSLPTRLNQFPEMAIFHLSIRPTSWLAKGSHFWPGQLLRLLRSLIRILESEQQRGNRIGL